MLFHCREDPRWRWPYIGCRRPDALDLSLQAVPELWNKHHQFQTSRPPFHPRQCCPRCKIGVGPCRLNRFARSRLSWLSIRWRSSHPGHCTPKPQGRHCRPVCSVRRPCYTTESSCLWSWLFPPSSIDHPARRTLSTGCYHRRMGLLVAHLPSKWARCWWRSYSSTKNQRHCPDYSPSNPEQSPMSSTRPVLDWTARRRSNKRLALRDCWRSNKRSSHPLR